MNPKGMMIFILKAIHDFGMPMDAFDIKACLRKRGIERIGSSTVPAQLWRLEKGGYVSLDRFEPCIGRGRPRKLYKLTQNGERAVLEITKFFNE